MYDALAQSVQGELLTDLYLKIKQGLVMQEQGGVVAQVREVKVVQSEPGAARNKTGFTERVTWQVEGTVEHWGHIHTRVNEYTADLGIAPAGGAWKITALNVVRQSQVQSAVSAEKAMIAISNLEFQFRRSDFRLAVPSLRIAPASASPLSGPSGSGKTTLLHLIAGILVPAGGTILRPGPRPALARRCRAPRVSRRADRAGVPELSSSSAISMSLKTSCCPTGSMPALRLDAGGDSSRQGAGGGDRHRAPPALSAAPALPGRETARRNLPRDAAASRRCCWPTSRPATSTRPPSSTS